MPLRQQHHLAQQHHLRQQHPLAQQYHLRKQHALRKQHDLRKQHPLAQQHPLGELVFKTGEGAACAAGTRMYRETPGSLLKAKAKDEPHWELIATSPEELTEVGERLRRSKKKPDQTLADQV